jgi:hypothetical protein
MKMKFKDLPLKMSSLLLLLSLLLGCNAIQPAATAPASPTPVPATATPPALPATATPPAAETNQLIVSDEFQGVIFTREKAEADQPVYQAEGYWTPTETDILNLESALAPYLEQAAPQDYPGPLKDLTEYKRQYAGLLKDGRQLIWVNFFCQVDQIDWQQEFVFVADGGSCYFELKYNPQTNEFSDLSIHGES